MPIIKYVAIHGSPLSLLRYVTNEKKTEKTLVSGINCPTKASEVYDEMERCFEHFAEERFWKKSLFMKNHSDGGKEKVRLHHYIQSFKAGETTAEEAHRIGMEWAKEVFGDKFKVLISTHTDKGHFHNHFVVCPYDNDGKLWRADKSSLNRCKEISDRIAVAHGLSIIEHPKKSYDHKYGNYLAKKRGKSWKESLKAELDELVLRDDVRSLDDLVIKLRDKGYGIHIKKYLAIKVKPNRKAIRTYRLGDGYFLEHLAYRIEHKDMEMPLSQIARYEGIQREYAICLRQMQMMVCKSAEERPYHITYQSVLKSFELLNFMHTNNVHSYKDLKALVDNADEKYSEAIRNKKSVEAKSIEEEKLISDFRLFKELVKHKPPTAEERAKLKELSYLADKRIFSDDDIREHEAELSRLRGQVDSSEAAVRSAKAELDKMRDYLDTYTVQTATQHDVLTALAEEEQERVKQEQQRESHEQTKEQKKRGISI